MSARQNIAIVGTGASGMTCAYLLQKDHNITLFEKSDYAGGHTNTIVVKNGPDTGTAVDTGFIVLNDKNYPLLTRLLARLDCKTRWSNMSFGYYSKATGLAYAGTGFCGMFAQPKNLFSSRFIKMLFEIRRFCANAQKDLRAGRLSGKTLDAYLAEGGYSDDVIRQYIAPMGGAIWSAPHQSMFEFPAETMLRFWENHGLLSLEDRPRWQTVVGGSQSYVKAILKNFNGKLNLNAKIQNVRRDAQGAIIKMQDGYEQRFDKIILAAHADESLKLLADPTADEERLLGAWSYQKNHTVLHTDISFLPPNRRAWASWNYVDELGANDENPVTVTYHMNRLQGLKTKHEYCVTLNPNRTIPEDKKVYEVDYWHPVYTTQAIASQRELPRLSGSQNTFYCGSYFGYGFHEDAVRSGVAVAKMFGIEL